MNSFTLQNTVTYRITSLIQISFLGSLRRVISFQIKSLQISRLFHLTVLILANEFNQHTSFYPITCSRPVLSFVRLGKEISKQKNSKITEQHRHCAMLDILRLFTVLGCLNDEELPQRPYLLISYNIIGTHDLYALASHLYDDYLDLDESNVLHHLYYSIHTHHKIEQDHLLQ